MCGPARANAGCQPRRIIAASRATDAPVSLAPSWRCSERRDHTHATAAAAAEMGGARRARTPARWRRRLGARPITPHAFTLPSRASGALAASPTCELGAAPQPSHNRRHPMRGGRGGALAAPALAIASQPSALPAFARRCELPSPHSCRCRCRCHAHRVAQPQSSSSSCAATFNSPHPCTRRHTHRRLPRASRTCQPDSPHTAEGAPAGSAVTAPAPEPAPTPASDVAAAAAAADSG